MILLTMYLLQLQIMYVDKRKKPLKSQKNKKTQNDI